MGSSAVGWPTEVGFVSDFRDLRVYQAAHAAAMEIFEVSKGFPDDERFSLTSQIRRSSRSVPTNIAEAWRKRRYPGAFVAKLSDADAEAAETRAHLDIALACGYLTAAEHERLDALYGRITGQLVRLITQAPRWAPDRASGRPTGGARQTPDPPTRVRGESGRVPDERERSASPPPIRRTESGEERSPGKEARR